jgi:hypothetical protein
MADWFDKGGHVLLGEMLCAQHEARQNELLRGWWRRSKSGGKHWVRAPGR